MIVLYKPTTKLLLGVVAALITPLRRASSEAATGPLDLFSSRIY